MVETMGITNEEVLECGVLVDVEELAGVHNDVFRSLPVLGVLGVSSTEVEFADKFKFKKT